MVCHDPPLIWASHVRTVQDPLPPILAAVHSEAASLMTRKTRAATMAPSPASSFNAAASLMTRKVGNRARAVLAPGGSPDARTSGPVQAPELGEQYR